MVRSDAKARANAAVSETRKIWPNLAQTMVQHRRSGSLPIHLPKHSAASWWKSEVIVILPHFQLCCLGGSGAPLEVLMERVHLALVSQHYSS